MHLRYESKRIHTGTVGRGMSSLEVRGRFKIHCRCVMMKCGYTGGKAQAVSPQMHMLRSQICQYIYFLGGGGVGILDLFLFPIISTCSTAALVFTFKQWHLCWAKRESNSGTAKPARSSECVRVCPLRFRNHRLRVRGGSGREKNKTK